ncbi:hypothetical protein [uncultured Methylibium sp.]|uniref:hypothetical protein n=1 Tax=uncultured Methylibium sp. TaxID=381093 RepID=UPI0025DA31DD|nr:hypothetical protein [uncultured Methylibium sp.]
METADATPAVEGPAFGRSARALATAVMLVLLAAAWRAFDGPALAQAGSGVKLLLGGTLAMMGWLYAWILRSRTRVAGGLITQSWLWDKRAEAQAIVNAKFVYVPGLAWLIAPRLIVRTRDGVVTQFHAADPAVLRAFAELTLALRERKAGRIPTSP